MGRKAEKGAGAIYAFRRRRDLAGCFPRISIPECDLLFARWRHRLFHRHRATPCSIAFRSIPRTACRRRAGVAVRPPAAGWAASTARCVDAEGLIWNARWGGSCVDAYSPQGERVRAVRVPAKQPSCPVFVGPNFDRAAGHHGLAGHGRGGECRRSAPWPNLHARRRRAGAGGTPRQARRMRRLGMRLAEPQPVIDHPFPSAGWHRRAPV